MGWSCSHTAQDAVVIGRAGQCAHVERQMLTPPGALVRVALRGQLVLRVLAVLQPRLLLRVQEVRPGGAGRQHKLQPRRAHVSGHPCDWLRCHEGLSHCITEPPAGLTCGMKERLLVYNLTWECSTGRALAGL